MASSSASTSSPSAAAAAAASAVVNSTTRLYVGNLHFTVDEYALIKIFSKYGKIAKLDFLFHKTGIMKGKPRGYAFIEFGSKEDALKALTSLHDKPLRGRNLVVTYASQAQTEPTTSHRSGGGGRQGPQTDRRTTLSIVKGQRAPQGAAAQIAALEAKLADMKRSASPATHDGPAGPGPTSEEKLQAGLPNRPSLGTTTKVPDGEGMNGTA
ncbi:hypothetical protein BDY24DRAFT_394610 [Mrakia frigida]|uniref:RNA binding motif protein 18 n=1 Tax=Mrakia frigida TaxID=29902 RepID=UPI003FCC055A